HPAGRRHPNGPTLTAPPRVDRSCGVNKDPDVFLLLTPALLSRHRRAFPREAGVCIYAIGDFAGRGDDRVRIRSLGEERHPKDLAHPAERERDCGNVEPRTPDRDGGRLSGPGRRGAPDAPLRGRGHVLEVRQHIAGIETRKGREPRVESHVGSRWLRLHSGPRRHHEDPRGGEEIQRLHRVQRRMVPPREAEPAAKRSAGPRVWARGPRPVVRSRTSAGEAFVVPDEKSGDGTIVFDRPIAWLGRWIRDVRVAFDGGRMVKFSASENEDLIRSEWEEAKGPKDLLGYLDIGLNPKAQS